MVVRLAGTDPFFTVQEAAEALKCSTRTINRYIASGLIEAKQGPTARLIPRDSLQKFINSFPDVGGAG